MALKVSSDYRQTMNFRQTEYPFKHQIFINNSGWTT